MKENLSAASQKISRGARWALLDDACWLSTAATGGGGWRCAGAATHGRLANRTNIHMVRVSSALNEYAD